MMSVNQTHEVFHAVRVLHRVLVGAVDPQHGLDELQVEGVGEAVRDGGVVGAGRQLH